MEFKDLYNSGVAMRKFKEYNESMRLDNFWYDLIGTSENYKNLWKCVQVSYKNFFCWNIAITYDAFSVLDKFGIITW